jgi:hypothetical protein
VKDPRSRAFEQSVVSLQLFHAVIEVAEEEIQYPPGAVQNTRMRTEVDIHHSWLLGDEMAPVASGNIVANAPNLFESEICALDDALGWVPCKK